MSATATTTVSCHVCKRDDLPSADAQIPRHGTIDGGPCPGGRERERAIAHRIFTDRLAVGEVAVFGNDAPEAFGLPGLGTISEFARSHNLEVVHIGMGCFSVRAGGREVLFFFGGGAMMELDGVHYTPLQYTVDNSGLTWLAMFRGHIAEFAGVVACTRVAEAAKELAQHAEVAEFADGRW